MANARPGSLLTTARWFAAVVQPMSVGVGQRYGDPAAPDVGKAGIGRPVTAHGPIPRTNTELRPGIQNRSCRHRTKPERPTDD